MEVPGGMRPGQMSIVMLGRVIMGDIAVTFVDLAQRGLVNVTPGDGDWLVTSSGQSTATPVMPFEQTLLDGLSEYAEPVPLLVLSAEFSLVLSTVRDQIVHHAVQYGWVRRWHHDQRTEAGAELARQLRAFRAGLRQLKDDQGEDALTGKWLPYALHFGLIPCEHILLASFAGAWVEAFSGLDSWAHAEPRRLGPDEISFPKDEWRGMPPGARAAWDMGL
jgi:hypothetical protein